jgi:exodeoxyribonuclease VIII
MNVIENMPAAEYHAHGAVSKSLLDRVARSPLHARAYLDGDRAEQTAAMKFGEALHTAVLEPSRFMSDYRVFDGDLRTKQGKLDYEALLATGATIIQRGDMTTVEAMSLAVRQHPTAGELLASPGVNEASVFWEDASTGLACRCRPDRWLRDLGIVVDVKTTVDASPEQFARSIFRYRYHVQAAHYLSGTKAQRFIFVAVEKEFPHAVAVYELDEASLALGMQARDQDLATLAVCMSSNEWPGYPAEIQTITLPAWSFPKSEESEEVEVSYVE